MQWSMGIKLKAAQSPPANTGVGQSSEESNDVLMLPPGACWVAALALRGWSQLNPLHLVGSISAVALVQFTENSPFPELYILEPHLPG